MASLNKVLLIGHLGADPELRFTGSDTPVANFRIATTETWKGQDGQKQEKTEWHRIVVWGNTAQACTDHLSKGSQVHIEGRIQTREWQDKEGNARRTTEIVADRVTFLSKARSPSQSQGQPGYEPDNTPDDTDVPF